MSEEKKLTVCLFDNDKECPVRTALRGIIRSDLQPSLILDKACPICPIHADMMKVKHTLK
jgi:hypothetical protein